MIDSWPMRLLAELRAFDEREAPHGLYGVRQAYSLDGKLPSLARIIASPKTQVLDNIAKAKVSGWQSVGAKLAFVVDGTSVEMAVIDYATTKVRHFGSAYRLDPHGGRSEPPQELQLHKWIARLGTSRSIFAWGTSKIAALLLVAHMSTARQLEALIADATDPDFLQRYAIQYFADDWPDRFGRGFHTGLYLWVSGPSRKDR